MRGMRVCLDAREEFASGHMEYLGAEIGDASEAGYATGHWASREIILDFEGSPMALVIGVGSILRRTESLLTLSYAGNQVQVFVKTSSLPHAECLVDLIGHT